MAKPVNPLDQLAIQNAIARYCEALDTKVWDLFTKVFTPDVVANYPFNPDMKGIDAVRNAISNRLGPIATHHALSTQTIVFGSDPRTANAVTYFVGSHFGQGPHEGKVLQAYGRYVDELVLMDVGEDGDYEGVPGASGVWRIKRRTVGFTKRVGDERIMSEF
ncbi:hypothetical protein BU26DRAFT_417387 [Trematosphaeria pertusa]|uniref:SnoaL-like domain-containing protein n=1 Tax=Trematosphaeria pertusa TaxID=390896 RepID=A0A6A6J1V5_9PLEO|nr:uncharacterized protein BU26DRAFT_417387 [Trematosphaeria pertusa]KAF2255443.1 hypothetical protein BU26DRAFT_417387 [Trematosphaeria pertusa]